MLLLKYIGVYSSSTDAEAIQAGYQAVVDQAWSDTADAENQYFVASATWSLDDWEAFLALDADPALSDSVRRSRIISKLRGSGVTTRAMIEQVAESYYNGDVEVTEQYGDYTFTIRFLSSRGLPEGLDQLKAAIEEIKPAHLGVVYVYLYTTHGDLRDAALTHEQLTAHTHAEIKILEV